MKAAHPAHLFPGVLLVAVPHMDDEILACGGSLAGLPHKQNIFMVYATNGWRSPVRLAGAPVPELGRIRAEEAREATSVLGIPAQNISFLGLPDGDLQRQVSRLSQIFIHLLRLIQPDQVLVPFRYDRHPDHWALYKAVVQAAAEARLAAELYEYFVYTRYRLLPGGDIRQFILPGLRRCVDIRPWSHTKRRALGCYRSQTTLFYDWQTRPILPAARVDEVSSRPEMFLKSAPAFPGAAVFGSRQRWIRLILTIEPQLKHGKEWLLAWLNAFRPSDVRRRE